MRIVPVPCLKDNYAYLVVCEASGQAAVVDPSEAGPVLAAVASEGVELVAIWNTHHHWDHTGGNKELLEAHPELAVVAHESDKGRIPGQSTFAVEGDEVELGDDVRASILFNPGHTTGAISFYLADARAVFTGDTLFAGGCGRIFEGDPPMMHASLTKLAQLPEATQVYCGHEYTQANLRFATAVEPGNPALAPRVARVDAQRAAGQPTMGFTIADERATNVFLRAGEPEVVTSTHDNERPASDDPVDVFAALRRWKDRF